jgi:hypothetical protein
MKDAERYDFSITGSFINSLKREPNSPFLLKSWRRYFIFMIIIKSIVQGDTRETFTQN